MIEHIGKPVPRPWRWWFMRDEKLVSGFCATKREARQIMFARMGLVREGSEASLLYRKQLGIE